MRFFFLNDLVFFGFRLQPTINDNNYDCVYKRKRRKVIIYVSQAQTTFLEAINDNDDDGHAIFGC